MIYAITNQDLISREKAMRVLFWYCDRFAWEPALQTLEDAPEPCAADFEKVVVAFVHVEQGDVEKGSSAETKLVKNTKWLARKWGIQQVILHSFSHLAEEKAAPSLARSLLDRAQTRLQDAGYKTEQTPYGYFLDLEIKAPGQPLARIFKKF